MSNIENISLSLTSQYCVKKFKSFWTTEMNPATFLSMFPFIKSFHWTCSTKIRSHHNIIFEYVNEKFELHRLQKTKKNGQQVVKEPRDWQLRETRHQMVNRNFNMFKVKKATTERYKSSAVISMQKLLNDEHNVNVKTYLNVISPVLRTCGSSESISLRKFTYK